MLFPTISFAIFFVATLLLYWLSVSSRIFLGPKLANHLRKFILLLASYIFYGIWDWRFLTVLIGSTVVNYLFAWVFTENLPYPKNQAKRAAQLETFSTNSRTE